MNLVTMKVLGVKVEILIPVVVATILCVFVFIYLSQSKKTEEPVLEKLPSKEIQVDEVQVDVSELIKQACIQWMYRNSEMPVKVLEEIYDTIEKQPYPDIVLAIVSVESRFNPYAVSKKGAMGLMQISPKIWAEELKKQKIITDTRQLYLIDKNIEAGVYIFRKYLLETKSLEKALYKYVGGSKKYVNRVLQALGAILIVKQEVYFKEEIEERG